MDAENIALSQLFNDLPPAVYILLVIALFCLSYYIVHAIFIKIQESNPCYVGYVLDKYRLLDSNHALLLMRNESIPEKDRKAISYLHEFLEDNPHFTWQRLRHVKYYLFAPEHILL